MCHVTQTINAKYWKQHAEVSYDGNCSQNPSVCSIFQSQMFTGPAPNRPANTLQNPLKQQSNSRQTGGQKRTSTSGTSNASGNHPDLSDKLGKDGKLTQAEWEHQMQKNLYMFCGQSGHHAKDCQKATSSAVKAHAAQAGTLDVTPSPALAADKLGKN